MFHSYSQVITWLLQVPPLTQEMAFSNLQQIKCIIQQPAWQPACPIITITGTNGKGSTVHTLNAIFSQAGYTVGTFTSPHLLSFNERIAINGRAICDQDFIQAAQATALLKAACPQHFFSILLLMALWHFTRQAVDIIILEVGLGGRLDPCNALDATILGITNIALDHTHLLGNTRELIAHEKACLMRPEKWCIVGDPAPPKTLSTYAEHIGTPLRCIGADFSYRMTSPSTFSWQGAQWLLTDLPVPRVKLCNIAVALAIVETLHTILPVNMRAIQTALAQLIIAGRYQCIPYENKTLLLDVAHNPTAIENLIRQVQFDFPAKAIHLVFGMMHDKDWHSCFDLLMTLNIQQCYFPSLEDARALDSATLSVVAIEKHLACHTYPTVSAALTAALANATEIDLIIVTGSFRTVGGVLARLEI